MTSVLIIDGKEFVPATIAGKHFGYTKDYILLLIKQNHFDGQKIGNKWYVNIPSAEKYFKMARAHREARKKIVSEERKVELKKYSETRTQSKKSSHHSMVIEVLAVVVIALSIGTTGYFGTNQYQASVHAGEIGFFENIARSLYAFINPSHTINVETNIPSQAIPVQMGSSVIGAHEATGTQPSLIVAPDKFFTATSVASIQDSFSDPVTITVDSENPNTGIITPVFKDGKQGEEYRFLMVPVERNIKEKAPREDETSRSAYP